MVVDYRQETSFARFFINNVDKLNETFFKSNEFYAIQGIHSWGECLPIQREYTKANAPNQKYRYNPHIVQCYRYRNIGKTHHD